MAKFGEFDEAEEESTESKRIGSMELGPMRPKAHLILKGSEQHEWGVVMDCHGCINYVPEDAEVVGVWHKYGSGTFWVSLLTPLKALEDTAVKLQAELDRERDVDMSRMAQPSTKKGKPRTKKAPAPVEEDTTRSRLDALRAKLKGG